MFALTGNEEDDGLTGSDCNYGQVAKLLRRQVTEIDAAHDQ